MSIVSLRFGATAAQRRRYSQENGSRCRAIFAFVPFTDGTVRVHELHEYARSGEFVSVVEMRMSENVRKCPIREFRLNCAAQLRPDENRCLR